MAIFGNSMGKFGQILINVMILDLFDYKYNSFIDFAKVEKKFWKFLKTLGKFSKKNAGHKTSNFENYRKCAYKYALKH